MIVGKESRTVISKTQFGLRMKRHILWSSSVILIKMFQRQRTECFFQTERIIQKHSNYCQKEKKNMLADFDPKNTARLGFFSKSYQGVEIGVSKASVLLPQFLQKSKMQKETDSTFRHPPLEIAHHFCWEAKRLVSCDSKASWPAMSLLEKLFKVVATAGRPG